jgi:SAM-dependent methyltransferase
MKNCRVVTCIQNDKQTINRCVKLNGKNPFLISVNRKEQLPFQNNYFDGVLLDNVTNINDIRRVLKPGGKAYIALHNKYNFLNLLRLPKKGKVNSGISVYSKMGYKNLLAKNGFENIQFYWPYPNYANTFWIMPLDGVQQINKCMRIVLKDYSGFRSLVIKLISTILIYMGILPYVVPNYLIAASLAKE